MPFETTPAMSVPPDPWQPPEQAAVGRQADDEDESLGLDQLVSEAMMLNMEASLRVFNERHLFAWTQGLMQGILSHQALICRLRRHDGAAGFDLLSYSTDEIGPDSIEALCRHDTALCDAMMQSWQSGQYRAILRDISQEDLPAEGGLQRRLIELGASRLMGHGTYDAAGQVTGFYLFAGSPERIRGSHLQRAELLVPLLHTALLRTRIGSFAAESTMRAAPGGREFLTDREQEVLRWMYLGKSNMEIGLILGISPLTVKNHVQAILRRLDVQNRAQAVGKAFKLRILSC